MKNLHRVKDLNSGEFHGCFQRREDARVLRDELEGPCEDTNKRRYVITLGPDHPHWRPEGGQYETAAA